MRSALLPALLLAGALAAGESSPGHAVAALIHPGSARAGISIDVAVELRIDHGWHLYWLNPGDSGLPPALTWTLPAGWRADPPRFPAPERLVEHGLASHVHHGTLVLLCAIHIPADAAGPQPLHVAVDWLACQEACVPGKAALAGELLVGAGDPDPAALARLEAARAGLPTPPPPGLRAEAGSDGDGVLLTLLGAAGEPLVFPLAEGVFRSDPPAATAVDGGWQARLPLAAGAKPPARLAAVVRHGDRAVSLDLAITPARSTP